MYWDETLHDGQGGWVEIPSYFTEDGHRINADVSRTGIYILGTLD
jgi:hypothetical protein